MNVGGYSERQPRYVERQGEADSTRIRMLENDVDNADRIHFFLDEKIKNTENNARKEANQAKEIAEEKARLSKEYVDEVVKSVNQKIDRLTWAFAGACLTFSLAVIIGIVNVVTGKL